MCCNYFCIGYTIIQIPEMILSFYWHVMRHTPRKKSPTKIDNDDKNFAPSNSCVSDASRQKFELDKKMNEEMINKSSKNLELRELRLELINIVEILKNEMELKFATKQDFFKTDSN